VAVVLLCDAALLSIEVDLNARGRTHAAEQLAHSSAAWFDGLYLTEVLLKLGWHGCNAFVKSKAHVFDATVTLVSIGGDVYAAWDQHPQALQVAMALRTLRLLRLVTAISHFELIVRRFVQMAPRLTGLFGALWSVFSIYAQLGVLLFGGTIYHGDAYERTANLTESDRLYTYCNFNDFGSAIVTLFELLVVNNWQVIMAAVVTVDGEWSRLYFFSWWVLAVLVFSNLLVAFILEEMHRQERRTASAAAHERDSI